MKQTIIIVWAVLATLIMFALCGAMAATNIRLGITERTVQHISAENYKLSNRIDKCDTVMRAVLQTRQHDEGLTDQLRANAALFVSTRRFRR